MTHVVDLRPNIINSTIAPQQLSSGATNGTGRDVSGFVGPVTVVVNAGAFAGTSPTLDAKVQESSDNSTYTDVTGATMTQLTASGVGTILCIVHTKQYLRVVATVGGSSTPTVYASAVLFGQPKIGGLSSSTGGYSVSPQS